MTFLHRYEDDVTKYSKGSVYWASMAYMQKDEENQQYAKKRPVVIVSSAAGSATSDVVTVCPLTTKLKDLSVNVDIDFSIDGRVSQVCCGRITTIKKSCLFSYAGEMSVADLEKVHKGILIALGLATPATIKTRQEVMEQRDISLKLEKLIPEAKAMVASLNKLITKAEPAPTSLAPNFSKVKERQSIKVTKRKYNKRTPEEIADFIREWNDKDNNRAEVAACFGFSSKGVAATFYKRHTEA